MRHICDASAQASKELASLGQGSRFFTAAGWQNRGNGPWVAPQHIVVQLIEVRWLDAIEKKEGPSAAWRAYVSLVEYAVPKMARNEIAGEGGLVRYVISWGGETPEGPDELQRQTQDVPKLPDETEQ
jgi:hypothetical protein